MVTAGKAGRSVPVRALFMLTLSAGLACSEPASNTGAGGVPLPDTFIAGVDAPVADGLDGQIGDGVAADGAGAPIQARQCVALGKGECDENSECGSDKYCDICLRKCLQPRKICEPCSADAQCAKAEVGSACIPFASGGTYCGLVCETDVGCSPGFACTKLEGLDHKQCVPMTGSCAPKAGLCKNDGECPYGTICNSDYGKCIKGCTEDAACASPLVCSLFRCTAPCTVDADCKSKASDAVCTDSHCKIPGGCLGPAECPDKATYCDMAAHKCKPGCQTDFDCKEYGKKCEATQCVQLGCKENWECAFEEVCVPATGKCKKAEGKFCATCDSSDDTAADCGGKPNRCFKFKDEEDKEHEVCGIACSAAPEGPCPQGYDCVDLKDQDGNSQGQFCLRECWKSAYPDKSGSTP